MMSRLRRRPTVAAGRVVGVSCEFACPSAQMPSGCWSTSTSVRLDVQATVAARSRHRAKPAGTGDLAAVLRSHCSAVEGNSPRFARITRTGVSRTLRRVRDVSRDQDGTTVSNSRGECGYIPGHLTSVPASTGS
jgi:hypothetical protein